MPTLNGASAFVDGLYYVFFNSTTITIAAGSASLVLADGLLASYTPKTVVVQTANTINTVASPIVYTETTTVIQFTIAGLSAPTISITSVSGQPLGTASNTAASTYTWTNATSGSVSLSSTGNIWLHIVDTTAYPNNYYKILAYQGGSAWMAWRDQTLVVTPVQNTIVKL